MITMILQAAKGKTEAAKEIREAVEGKALVRLRHEVPGSGPIQDESVGVEEIKNASSRSKMYLGEEKIMIGTTITEITSAPPAS